ncbi:hypothetical protein [Paenibacillus sp. HW567]|uniref:hypothetical protein n=1 Tax=Paenibacillus sp. HW567 TaxID=1034769 RepID=UPI00035F720E|nr:hypothetical protein [Paenibacillus sp. HW567]
MFKNKDWKELMQEFKDKVDKREVLIQSNIDGLQEKVEVIKGKIKDNADKMIEAEMNEDTNGLEKFKKENRKLRLDLEEIQDSIAGYETQIGTSRNLFVKDLDKIRDAANKAEEERIRWTDEIVSKRKDLESEIKEIEKQISEINNELIFSRAVTEQLEYSSYLIYIDPRSKSLKDYEKKSFINSWLSGDSLDRYFK